MGSGFYLVYSTETEVKNSAQISSYMQSEIGSEIKKVLCKRCVQGNSALVVVSSGLGSGED